MPRTISKSLDATRSTTVHTDTQESKPARRVWPQGLFQSVDIASSALFRICYGAVMMWWSFDFLRLGLVNEYFVRPGYYFSYENFFWIRPLPSVGMPILFGVLTLLALMIAIGLFYRVVTVTHWCGFVYVFLLDQTNYQNHYYLLILIGALLPFMPLNRCWSIDAHLWPALRGNELPRWCLLSLRFHIALPYFFGGIAKLNFDWLSGVTLTQRLNWLISGDSLGSWITTNQLGTALAWSGMLFDLSIVPLLLWKKTRVVAFVLTVLFHVTNHFLFQIHIFPWFMIAATTLFLSPDWPRRFMTNTPGKKNETVSAAMPDSLSWGKRIGLTCLALEMSLQIVLPLRCHFYQQDASWTEVGHRFAWRMMLRSKIGMLQYLVTDPATHETYPLDHTQYLNAQQAGRFPRDPRMIQQFGHFIADEYQQLTGRRPIVRAIAIMSLNGRKPQLLVDPQIDLAKTNNHFTNDNWIVPLREPLRSEPWNVPKEQWLQHVDIPLLKELQLTQASPNSPQDT
ncbi:MULTISPECIES: HTTM domain-containing protein [Pirellulaceae]|nr:MULTISPECIES: HTTM domain-containing protein [Pirellulaceae]